jgi:16S rRNA (cytosine1407-C5)-methyltransferase
MARRKKKNTQAVPSQSAVQAALERFAPLLETQDYAALLRDLEIPLSSAIRANPLKANSLVDVPRWAEEYGWRLEKVPFCSLGWWVKEAQTTPSQTIEHRMGAYYIQDAASMLPVELFDLQPDPDQLILDLAASPGGKTTHLISRAGDQGLVLANDASRERITALRLVLQTWGAINQAVLRFQAEQYGRWFPETFDRVLLDAPCSMQGLRTSESHPSRPISDREVQQLARRQTRMLESALQALKTGGQVVYSTCTLTPEEDELVLDALLKEFPGALRIEDARLRLPLPAPALRQIGETVLEEQVEGAARIWPHRYHTAGFFAALITKTGPVPARETQPPARPLDVFGLEAMDQDDLSELRAWLEDQYGFNLATLLEENRCDLWQKGSAVFIVPELYLRHFASLPFQSLGMMLGEFSPEGFVPSHEWLSRFSSTFSAGRIELSPDLAKDWLRGEDISESLGRQNQSGVVVAVIDSQGRYIGRGKLADGKIKNLLPRRLVWM